MIRKLLLTTIALLSTFVLSAQKEIHKGDINLMVVSDLGRNGFYEQRKVAETMGKVAEYIGPDAILALGDTHHYMGVQSVSDPLWMTNFELIYQHPELMVEWYPICGNHEYRGNTQAIIEYSNVSRRWNMPAKYYTKTFADNDVSVRVVFLDTPPLISKYRKQKEKYPDASHEDAQAQLDWLEQTLSNATEDWIVVVGHHPIYADTDKSVAERDDMQKKVNTILLKYNVDMYVCGHIHNYQHIRVADSKIDYIVNTSGSKTRMPKMIDGTIFCSGDSGFAVLTASKEKLRFNMLNNEGNIIHIVTRQK